MQYLRNWRPRQCYTLVAVFGATLIMLSFLFMSSSGTAISKVSETVSSATSMLAQNLADPPNTDLVLFAYYETENTRRNLQFFIDHGLHGKADFIFIINGDELSVDIPVAKNIQVIRRANTCYDLGAYGEVLNANNGILYRNHKRFIMLNGSVRGPFLPYWSREFGVCWSDVFLRPLSDKVKLVGTSANCDQQYPRHLQSMVLSTDRIGLDLIMPGLQCAPSWQAAVDQGEISLLSRVLAGGYFGAPIYSMMASNEYESLPEYWDSCSHEDIFWPHSYDGMDVHPFDTVFVKTQRLKPELGLQSPYSEDGQRVVDKLTEWADRSKYSSYDYC